MHNAPSISSHNDVHCTEERDGCPLLNSAQGIDRFVLGLWGPPRSGNRIEPDLGQFDAVIGDTPEILNEIRNIEYPRLCVVAARESGYSTAIRARRHTAHQIGCRALGLLETWNSVSF